MAHYEICCNSLLRTVGEFKRISILNFLPKQKKIKMDILNTQRYCRIKDGLSDVLTEAYIAFSAFIMSHDFESFLLPYQSGDPMIHMLYLCKFCITSVNLFGKK